ncbi:MAG: hypothetical protein LBD77_08940 [Bifidobacteriaceae bacterium]|nr:hypothetical protein [Bifidobacteriaceae bacterium]
MTTNRKVRMACALVGAGLLTGLGGLAFADEEVDTGDVDVTVEILGAPPEGALAMTVADDEATLTEVTSSDPLLREFSGTLPLVTVTDTRDPDDIDPLVGWYVLGSATDFVGDTGQPDIPVDQLGWTPLLVDGGTSGGVTQGDPVYPSLDTAQAPDNVGLVDQELLAMAINSAGIAEEEAWTAEAALILKTDAAVAAGSYSSVLTLTLFE